MQRLNAIYAIYDNDIYAKMQRLFFDTIGRVVEWLKASCLQRP